jgi:hypothetical protein
MVFLRTVYQLDPEGNVLEYCQARNISYGGRISRKGLRVAGPRALWTWRSLAWTEMVNREGVANFRTEGAVVLINRDTIL